MESSATVAVLFCDIVDSTARQARLGDRSADEMRHRLFPQLSSCVVAGGGEVVKTLGDGLMAVFEHSTIGALECAVRMHACTADFDPGDPLHLRIGVSIGEVVNEDGDWFGTPVVQAARLCDAAEADGTLANSMVASLVGSRGDHYTFEDAGERQLKGLSDPVSVVALLSGTDADGRPLGVPEPPGAVEIEPSSRNGSPSAEDTDGGSVVARRVRALPLVATFAVLLVVVGGAAVWRTSAGSSTDPPAPEASTVAAEVVSEPIGYEPMLESVECGDKVKVNIPGARCGFLLVPENRENPESRTIRIHYVMAPAKSDTGADPVVMMGFNEKLDRTSLTNVADVYSLSIRGFDELLRADLRCPGLVEQWEASFAKPPTDPGMIRSIADAAGSCADELRSEGVDLDGYNWSEVALDIRDLAIAESLERVNVATEGYLALAAVPFARSNPGMVASLLLTNPVAPGTSALAEAPRSTALELDHLDGLCGREPECARALGDLRSEFDKRADSMDAAPVMVSTDSLDGEGPYDVLVDGDRLGAALYTGMRASAQVGLVPASMQGASPDLIAAVSINGPMKAYVEDEASPGADLSLSCSYDAQPVRVSETLAVSETYIAGAESPAFAAMCDAWDVKLRFDDVSAPLQEGVPVLVAEGGLSAAAVNDWGEELTQLLESPVMLRFDTLSEDLIDDPPACLARIRNAFVVDPSSVTGVEQCERESPPIDWVLGL